jgi:hypothetical protein
MVALAMRLERVRRLAFRTVSQIGINYRDSAMSETLPGMPAAGPLAGDRFPWLRPTLSPNNRPEDLYRKLDDTRFTLIVVGQPAPPTGMAGVEDLLRILVIPNDPANDRELARVQIPRIAFYLLRPDGHIALCGTQLNAAAVTRYLSQRIGLRTPHLSSNPSVVPVS